MSENHNERRTVVTVKRAGATGPPDIRYLAPGDSVFGSELGQTGHLSAITRHPENGSTLVVADPGTTLIVDRQAPFALSPLGREAVFVGGLSTGITSSRGGVVNIISDEGEEASFVAYAERGRVTLALNEGELRLRGPRGDLVEIRCLVRAVLQREGGEGENQILKVL